MFDIGWGELVLIGLAALIVVGPKELPTVLRTAGQWMGKVKRMASEFQGQFQEALREAEVSDLKEQADNLTGELKSITEYDPLADIDNDSDTEKEKEDGASEWDETPFETPEHEPAAESVSEPHTEIAVESAGEAEPAAAAPVTPVETAPAEELTDIDSAPKSATPVENADLTPAETPPPKQAGGSA